MAIAPIPEKELDTPFETPINALVVVRGFTLRKHKGMLMQGAVQQDLEPGSDYLFEPHPKYCKEVIFSDSVLGVQMPSVVYHTDSEGIVRGCACQRFTQWYCDFAAV